MITEKKLKGEPDNLKLIDGHVIFLVQFTGYADNDFFADVLWKRMDRLYSIENVDTVECYGYIPPHQ